jgi:23S rRNA pseudouridine1911/1915/1917 synthase
MTPCTWAVTEAEAGQRLDQCVINQLQFSYSRARIQRWLAQGYIQLNDQQGTPSRRVKIGDRVVVDVERAAAHEPIRTLRPEEMPLDVIHEDEDILVVNKSAGIVTHPAPGNWSGTLVNAVLWHLQQQGRMPIIDPRRDSAASGLQPLRPGIVHRLDKEHRACSSRHIMC